MNFIIRILNWLRMQSTSNISTLLIASIVLSILIVSQDLALSQTTRPTWIDNPALEYQPGKYIIGLGYGESPETAILNARSDLAAGLRARVSSVMRMEDDVAETFGSKSETFDRVTAIHKSTEVEASENLANVTLGGTWFDDVTDLYHAIVFIKRDEAEQTITTNIKNILAQIARLNCDGCYSDILVEYAGAIKAIALFREYEELSAQLCVLSEGREGEIDVGLRSRVASWFTDTQSRLTLTFGIVPSELAPFLRDALISAGFTVVDEHALFTAELIYVTSPVPHAESFVFENWEMSLRIRRTDDGSEVITLNRHNRAGHKSREAAQERCLREAKKVLTGEFSMNITSFLAEER